MINEKAFEDCWSVLPYGGVTIRRVIEAYEEAKSVSLPSDEQLVAKMLLACDGLEDLNDCMAAALQVLKPFMQGVQHEN